MPPFLFFADETSTTCGGCGRPLTSGVCSSCTPGIPQDPLTPPKPRRDEERFPGRGRYPLPSSLEPRLVPVATPERVARHLTRLAGGDN